MSITIAELKKIAELQYTNDGEEKVEVSKNDINRLLSAFHWFDFFIGMFAASFLFWIIAIIVRTQS